ncbi:MAG: sodium:proton antiporter [Holosporales bacterium]|jgi:Na+/H+ antiporter NhaD/arsenite permease-like protein|nr:sodium:proton antiporter [Holosporales bacterium]
MGDGQKSKCTPSKAEQIACAGGGRRFFGALFSLLPLYVLFCIQSAHAGNVIPPAGSIVPFAGVLLSIAIGPLLFPAIWHKYDNVILAAWTILSTWLCFHTMGKEPTGHLIAGIFLKEYVPLIVLIGTLYIISSGIGIRINRAGTTSVNVAIIATGEILSNLIGTTGTSMLLLRPLLDVNKTRKYKVHTLIFFIFLVSNIGGCLLPFGDPPLFLGYLKGVSFFWTAKHMFPMFLVISTILMFIYIVIDRYLIRKETISDYTNSHNISFEKDRQHSVRLTPVQITGYFNIALMVLTAAFVAGAGMLPKKEAFSIFGSSVHYKGLLRDIGLCLISAASIFHARQTLKANKEHHKHVHSEEVSWAPITEVTRYFAAIFITMAPVAAMLKGGHEIFSPICNILKNTEHPSFWYFWFVSPFSAFLDNAPTYVVFFKMAGGDALSMMVEHARTLTAISAGSVFMGAMTYIGNAPNFMVKSIAKQHGVHMPSFLGYMGWSSVILLPVLAFASYLFLY